MPVTTQPRLSTMTMHELADYLVSRQPLLGNARCTICRAPTPPFSSNNVASTAAWACSSCEWNMAHAGGRPAVERLRAAVALATTTLAWRRMVPAELAAERAIREGRA